MSLYLGKEKINNLSIGQSSSGPDTSDATATADDILSGKTAYVNGEKIESSMAPLAVVEIQPAQVSISQQSGQIYAQGVAQSSQKGYYDGQSTRMVSIISLDKFGNATAADIAKGKTFTSADGLKRTGTATSSSQSDITYEYCIGEVSSDGHSITWTPTFLSSVTSIKVFIIDTLDIASQDSDVFQILSSSGITNSQYCVINLELNTDGNVSGIFVSSGVENYCEAISSSVLSAATSVNVQGTIGVNIITLNQAEVFMFNPKFSYGILLTNE